MESRCIWTFKVHEDTFLGSHELGWKKVAKADQTHKPGSHVFFKVTPVAMSWMSGFVPSTLMMCKTSSTISEFDVP